MAKSGTMIFACDHEQGRSNVYMLDPRDIACDWRKNLSRGGLEPVVDDELIALAESMAPQVGPGDAEEGSSGQLNPVLVRQLPDRRAELVGGFRRYRAALWLVESGRCSDFKLKCTRCTLSDAEAALVNMDENMQRSDPQPLQLAHAIRALHEGYGLAIATISRRLRKSGTYINYLLKLTGLPTVLQEAIADGTASVAAMAELTDLPAPVAIEVFNATKEAKGVKVRAKDLMAAGTRAVSPEAMMGEVDFANFPTPTGTPTKAAAVAAGKGPKIQASDIKAAKQSRKDAAIDAGETVVDGRPKNRKVGEILEFFADISTAVDTVPAEKKLAIAISKFMRGEATAGQLTKVWNKTFAAE